MSVVVKEGWWWWWRGNGEDIPTASHSPKGEWQHMRFTIDTVLQDREGSTHIL